MSKPDSTLERLVVEIQEAGQAWVEARLKSDQLEADEKNFLAALMNELERGFDKVSEAKLERLVRGSKEYRNYVTGRTMAAADTGRRRVRYEALQNYFEAQRSIFALERAKIEKGIFDKGG